MEVQKSFAYANLKVRASPLRYQKALLLLTQKLGLESKRTNNLYIGKCGFGDFLINFGPITANPYRSVDSDTWLETLLKNGWTSTHIAKYTQARSGGHS